MIRRFALILPLIALCGAAASPSAPQLATLAIPGTPEFADVARDVVDVAFSLDPSVAAGAGLFDDALRVPRYDGRAVHATAHRLDVDLSKLRGMPWRSWDVDSQIDWRWTYAVAETLHQQLMVERMFVHRPGQWLEPVANDLIALASYAPDRPELQDQVIAQIPAMLAVIRTVCTEPTRRDAEIGAKVASALSAMAELRHQTAAATELSAYARELTGSTYEREFAVVGANEFAWRLKHAVLLPWTPAELLALANQSLAEVDAKLAALPPASPSPAPTPEQTAIAASLNRDGQLALYDAVEEANRQATIRGGWVTVKDGVGPIHARETPEAMIPLTGDGGSMNPPPTFVSSNIGYWNVEHFRPDETLEERLDTVVGAQGFLDNGLGPYSAHEGFPGHHLQLSIARMNPDPLRSILPDGVENEGWGLYAEEEFSEHGGLGSSPAAQRAVLGSYRHRIRRVVYDTNIETGAWTLQQGADYKYGTPAGQGKIEEEVMRSINWPTQLCWYYAGKSQIVALREEVRTRLGAAFDLRAFHDAFLAEGSIPVALIRAKMLGEPVPDIDPGPKRR
jgi:hypothetical protein